MARKGTTAPLKRRGMLIHLTHYDPRWNKEKETEERYDRATAEAVIDAMADAGMNLLLIDVEDGVIYKTLPELRKRYSVPIAELRGLALRARKKGLEVIPKLNFARSPLHRHSAWLDPNQAEPDSAAFWKRGFAAIDEVLAATEARTLHVGMDEDDTRSPEEYRKATMRLYRGLKRRGVRMAMWAEVGHRWRPQQRWKEIPAIRELPRDAILMPWSYHFAQTEWVPRLKRWGFEVIGACGYSAGDTEGDPSANAREWCNLIRSARADGLVLTKWIRCSAENREALVQAARTCGELMA